MPKRNETPVERLTRLRKELADYPPIPIGVVDPAWERLNQAVAEAEKAVPAGRLRGWNYESGDA